MADGVLTGLHIHPIKSCHRIELQEATVSVSGLAGDREWQLVDVEGRALTQRTVPKMATVRPTPIPGGLRLDAPGAATVEVAVPDGEPVTVRALLGDKVSVGDAGDEASTWLEQVLGIPCRLVRLATPDARRIAIVDAQPVSFADAAPVLVANQASLADLQARAREPFGMERFRPNLVVAADQPWVEDTWRSLTVGAAALEAIAPWPRCAVPQVDQDNGERHSEPAVALRAHRWCTAAPSLPEGLQPFFTGQGLFGLACTIAAPGTVLRVGDPFSVHARGDALIPAPAPLA
ncbi:MAG: MOSC domain-containing protein [Acidimicrobiales bacterium]